MLAKQNQRWSKRAKVWFFGMLLGTSGASLLGYLLTGEEVIRTGEEIIRAGQYF